MPGQPGPQSAASPRPRSGGITVHIATDAQRAIIAALVGASDGEISPKDTVIVAEFCGRIVGHMAVRLVPLVHDMEIEPGNLQRRIAESMLHYAKGYVKASDMTEALVLVGNENEAMQRFILGHGAIEEEPCGVYLMGVS